MKKKLLSVVISLSLVVSLGVNASAAARNNDNPDKLQRKALLVDKLSKLSDGNLKVYTKGDKEKEVYIAGKLSEKKNPTGTQALAYLNEIKDLLDLDNTDSFKVVSFEKDDIGFTHVKLQQTVEGTGIQDKYLMVHFNGSGEITSVNGQYDSKVNAVKKSRNSKVDEAKAIETAKAQFTFEELRKAPEVQREVVVINNENIDTYKINIQYNKPEIGNWDVYVDVYSGDVVNKVSRIRYDGPTTGTGVNVLGQTKNLNLTLTSGKYYMQDQTKAMTGQIKTYTANNAQTQPGTLVSNTTSTFNTTSFKAAVSAHDYAGVVYDFYKNLFGRNSIDNAGMSIISTVHYGSAYNNAFWDGSQMVYGDGDGRTFTALSGDLDVVGHEMTHGVTERTANLTYANQSGALNESMSDVLGVLISSYNKYNVKNGGTWTFNSADWVVGDDVYTPGTSGDALRSLADPTKFGQPAHMNNYVNSPNTEAGDWGGVHTNSGIPNKAGYLVAQAIGNEKTARIYYRALVNYMTSSTNFLAARNSLVQAATDLYGASSAEVTAVNNAFNAVGVVQVSDSYEPNGTMSQAYAIASGTTYSSLISSATDVDYYKFSVSTAKTISLSLTTLPKDYDLYLYNSAGTLVAKSENGSTTSESISYSAKAGTYYVKVSGYNGAYSTTKYSLKATY